MFKDLGLRTISAAVMLPVAAFIIWKGGLIFSIAVVALSVLAAREAVRLAEVTTSSHRVVMMVAIVTPVVLGAFGMEGVGLLVLIAATIGLVLVRILRVAELQWRGIFGVIYLGLAFLCAEWLRSRDTGLVNWEFLLVVVVASDVGAYITGRMLGGPKLWPAVSPKKTWSGSIGGVFAAVLGIFFLAQYEGLVLLPVLIAAFVVSIASQGGDLLESWAKRKAGVKDSGSIIPGHGGLLDRLDGFLAAAPAFAGIILLGQAVDYAVV